MDFRAFKRSKALQSPVCLLGWNSKGTSVSMARGTRGSVAVTAHVCRCIDWRRVWALSWSKLKQRPGESPARLTCPVPKAQQPSFLHGPPREPAPIPVSRERRRKAEEEAPLVRTQGRGSSPSLVPVPPEGLCQHHGVLLEKPGNGREKT